MKNSKVFKVILMICRFGMAALFLFTAGAKLSIVTKFAYNVAELLNAVKLDPVRWAWPVTIVVIAAEIVVAILLILRRTTRVGALAAAVLLVGFSAFALYYRYGLGNAEGLECGCFGGIIASQLGVTTAIRNLALLVPTIIVFFGYRQPAQSPISNLEQLSATS
jgi:DoxX